MRIVHICLNSYIDNWGYQENLLPEYQRKNGDEVIVIASRNKFHSYLDAAVINAIKKKGTEYFIHGIKIVRIKTSLHISTSFFISHKLSKTLSQLNPDMIFHHGVNPTSMLISVLYKKGHPNIRLFVDNHADYINQSPYKLWNYIYNKVLLRMICFITQAFVNRFFGVTQLRCEYLEKEFLIDRNRIKLLPIGADTDFISNIPFDKLQLRKQYGIPLNHIVIISGGKLSASKGILSLINAFKRYLVINQHASLILFGKFTDKETELMSRDCVNIITKGWCDRVATFELLRLSDVAIWPIHHTTLIEDAVACGLPLILRKTGNTTHLIDKNGIFLEKGDEGEIYNAFKMISNREQLEKFRKSALLIRNKLSYDNIVKIISDD